MVHGLVAVLFPHYSQTPIPAFIFFVLGEIPIMLWLLIKGVKDYIAVPVIAERHISSQAFSEAVQEPVIENISGLQSSTDWN